MQIVGSVGVPQLAECISDTPRCVDEGLRVGPYHPLGAVVKGVSRLVQDLLE